MGFVVLVGVVRVIDVEGEGLEELGVVADAGPGLRALSVTT